ncbi:MAG TPA: hypothetical protein VF590_01705, partial [Isosphaeraceae bacterium]
MRSRRSTHHLRRIRRPASSPRVEILEDRWLLATFTVANTNDGGAGSLRQALLDANATPGTDTVAYNLPGTGPFTIRPTSALPRVDDPIIIDGYTQPGSVVNTRATGDNAVLRVVIDGSAAGAGVTGLTIAAGGSTVRGLVINGFSGAGLKLLGGGNSLIEGNFLGTNASGTAALGNGNLGDGSSTDCLVVFNSSGNTIGGTTAASRNLISGNRGAGLVIEGLGAGAANNLIAGNSIGTNAAGTAALGNGRDGVRIVNAPENTVGGTTPGAGNIIAGTAYVGGISGSGVAISGPGATGNLIVGNSIGTNAAVSIDLGNAGVGVQIDDASGNTIGGTAGGAGNTIAFNRNAGVAVRSGRRNAIAGNAIYSNGGLGIDLGADGMTPNDPDDADTGPNDLQNAPLLISAAPSGGTTTVGGTLHGRRNTAFRIDFHASGTQPTNGVGERRTSLGSLTVSTDDSGNARFTATFPVAAAPGADFAATATDPAGNTSEYSRSVALGAGDRFEANDSLTNA